MKLKSIMLLTLVILCLCLCSCSEKKVSTTEFALNTMISLTIYGDNADAALKDAVAEVKRIESLLSCHIETSEISLVNKSAHLAPVKVSKETAELLKKALKMCEKTKGAFDISIKPLVDLWNINSRNPVIPTDEEIKNVIPLVDYRNISIDGDMVSFKKEGMQIDLGGAAKGYCADKLVEVLKKHNIKNAIIDLGGNIYALGKNEQKKPWRIGLQDPGKSRGEHFSIEELSDKTVVTSGSYERYFESDGKIYHHIIDPQKGKPADNGLISVSVVADSSFEADILSTAIFVMGYDSFKEIQNEFSFTKYITVDKENTPRTYYK